MGSVRWPLWAKRNSAKRIANRNSTGKLLRRTARPQVEKLEDRLALAPIVTPHYEIPNFGDYETIHSDSSGAWSNPDTWSAGRVPTANDVVVISAGTSVTYDLASSAALDSVVIYAGGLLNFRTDISTQMLVTNLQVLEGGELRVGTAANPVAADVTAQIIIRNVALDTVRDPSQFGNGLIGLGKITMHGANRVSYVRLDAEPRVGHTTLTLEAPATGWRVGDKLILPDSKQWLRGGETYLSSIETVTIAAISADRKTITLTTPLQFDHPGARNGNDVLEFLPHVVNRTRNIVVRSESPTGTRGYVLFTGRADVDVRYASFAGTGRTKLGATDAANPTDRFPVTFSHLYGPAGGQANGYQYTFVGNAVFCPLQEHDVKWGIAIRDSHYGLIKGNVLFNWAGSSLVTLQGNETENRIEGNFAVGGRGRGDNVGSFGGGGFPGDEGAGFWFFGPNNRILNNVATSCMNPNGFAAYGYKIYNGAGTVRFPNFAGADTTIAGQYTVRDTATMRILEWDGNEGYGLEDGLTFWYVNTIGAVPQNGGESVVKNSLMWHIAHYGYFGYPTADVTFDGWVQRGYKPHLQHEHLASVGLTNGDYFADHFRVRNADIQGLTYGIMDGTYGDSDHLIENSYLRNVQNIAWSTLRAPGSGGAPVNRMPRSLTIRNVTFGSTASWNVGATPRANIALRFVPDPFEAANLIQSDTIFVENYNGTGTNYQVFYNEQRADFIVPQTNATGSLLGSPVAGLTNQQNWDQFGIAIAGAVAPAGATTVPGILGLAKSFVVPPDSTSPSSPTGLSAAAASTSQINLTWTAATDNLGVAGYRIYRNGAHVGTTSATSYSAMGLAAGTSYTFTVVAFDAAGNVSPASAPASATTLSLPSADSTPPSTPSGLSATAASSSRIDLAWTASTDNVQVAGYRIFRNGVQIGTSSSTSFAATGLAAGTTYNFIVRAYDAAGNVSANSNTASATTLPPPPAGDTTAPSAPTGLAGTAVSTSRINLTWNAATDNVGVTGYRIFRNGTQIGTSSSTSFAATGLATGTTYNFIVRAYDAAGNVSGNSSTATVTTLSPPPADTTAPSAPTGLAGTAASTSRINLTWNAATDNVGVTGYRIFQNGVVIGTTSSTSYAATDLATGTTYNFIVRAYDAAGNVSGNSNTATVTTLSPPTGDTTRPSAPTGLAGTAASTSRINLTWDAATDNVGVTGYRIFRNGVGIGTAQLQVVRRDGPGGRDDLQLHRSRLRCRRQREW